VHHNEGMLFLRSIDISTVFKDVDELASVVRGLVHDIGVTSIVQIITNDASPYMQAVEYALEKKYNHSFVFTLCADYCINLLLEHIAALDHVNEVLMKARDITRFIYSNALPMELKKIIFRVVIS
jgi:adenosine/AMP kinase